MNRIACLARAATASVLLSASASFAVSSGDALDFTIHQPYVSPRALGMGNAFASVADDYSAIFYNPAGLARLTESQTNLEIRGMIDSGVLKFKEDIEKASDANTSVEELNQILTRNYGKHYSARVPTVGAYRVWPRWGIALVPADLSLELGVNQLVGPALSLVATQDSTLAIGFGFDVAGLRKNRLSFGATVKGIYRAYYNRSFSGLDLATDSNLLRVEDAKEGFTVDGDVGMLFTPEVPRRGFFSFLQAMQPTLGFAVRNISDHGFGSNFHLVDQKTTGKPPNLQRRYDAGASLALPDWWVWKSRFAFEMRDMGHQNWTFRKGMHAGVEFNWKVRSWWQGGWRAGLNQGYWTAGFTAKFAIFQLDLLSYGEEVGPSDLPKENRRYMAKCSLDW